MLQIANFSTKEEDICTCTQATILEKCPSYAPINIMPQDGGGGQTQGNLTFSGKPE